MWSESQPALGHERRQQHLAPARGVEVRALLHLREVLTRPRRCDRVPDPQPRHDELGERPQRDHVVRPRCDRRQLLTCESERPIGIVLDDHEPVLLGELGEVHAPLEGERRPRRVLEVDDRVEQPRPMSGFEQRLKRRRVDPVLVDRHGQQRGLEHLQRLDRADVAGLVDRDLDAGFDEHLRHEVERLLRAVGDQHLVGVDLATAALRGLVRDPRRAARESLRSSSTAAAMSDRPAAAERSPCGSRRPETRRPREARPPSR